MPRHGRAKGERKRRRDEIKAHSEITKKASGVDARGGPALFSLQPPISTK